MDVASEPRIFESMAFLGGCGLAASAALLGGIAHFAERLEQSASSEEVGSKVEVTDGRTAADWRTASREDVNAAYDIFRRQHPGMFDSSNRSFPAQLRRARDTALAFGKRVKDAEGHMRALALFSAGLADGHARVQASYSGQAAILWPGFRTVWRENALHVSHSIETGLPLGSVLLGCDGRKARTVIRALAFTPYGRPREEGQWWVHAPLLFLRPGTSYEVLPSRCRFRHPDRRTVLHKLVWRPVPEMQFRSWFDAESRREPVGLAEPRSGLFHITLSDFSPGDESRANYARLFAEIDEKIDRIVAARAVVLDLRSNRGGSSSWSRAVAERLWGEAAVTTALAAYFRDTQIWWLVHPATISHLRQAATRMKGELLENRSKDADYVTQVASRLEEARKRGQRFYVEDYGASFVAADENAPPRRLPPVYVVTDGGCVSACLDAVDLFTRFPDVKLIGAPTSADSTYLESRIVPLPSGRGIVVTPTKIWLRRPRRGGEVYRPDIPVNDLDSPTAVIIDRIEKDVANRRSGSNDPCSTAHCRAPETGG